jgi:hypothetical protein
MWATPEFASERDALIRDLHITWARVAITPKLAEEDVADHMSTADVLAAIERARATKGGRQAEERYKAFAAEAGRLGLKLHFVSWAPPRRWMETVQFQRQSIHRMLTERVGDYANYVAAEVIDAKRNGLTAEAIEFVNEPNTYEDRFKPEVYAAAVPQVRAALDAAGFQALGIEGPGTSQTYAAGRYLEALRDTRSLATLRFISMHDYDTVNLPEPSGLAGLADARGLIPPRDPIYITEFGSSAPRWKALPYAGGPMDRVAGRLPTAEPPYAVATVAEGLRLIGDGATGVAIWQLQDLSWGKGTRGLLDLDGHRRPAAEALRAVFGALPADVRAIGPQAPAQGIGAAAFTDSGGTWLALANLTDGPRPVRAEGHGVAFANGNVRVLAAYPVTATASGVAVAGSAVDVTIPANTVLLIGPARGN